MSYDNVIRWVGRVVGSLLVLTVVTAVILLVLWVVKLLWLAVFS